MKKFLFLTFLSFPLSSFASGQVLLDCEPSHRVDLSGFGVVSKIQVFVDKINVRADSQIGRGAKWYTFNVEGVTVRSNQIYGEDLYRFMEVNLRSGAKFEGWVLLKRQEIQISCIRN